MENRIVKDVDIIIPIYNALDDLKICLESIYKHTDLTRHRLILINDNSPDENIRPFLEEQKHDNIIVIHNHKNKGFSENINLGIEQSANRDVILLNSDTIVTARWVEKMLACAYSSEEIGTVTPLSNNATLCSVPVFCEENALPEGMSVEQMAGIVERCSLREYPRITVAHGFCMLVKREVIETIGKFDAATFGRGYGEENDFCNRAEQMGYIHVMCDDTYIYHSGTKSFVSKEKEEYIKEHDKILNERYPVQMHGNAVYCRDNPNGWVGENIEFHMNIWNERKNILYLLQSDFREDSEDNVGGTQLHVKHLTQIMRKNWNVIVAARNHEYLQVTAYTQVKEYVFRFYIGRAEEFPLLRNSKIAKIFETILCGFRVDMVHVHHTATTSLDIYYEAHKLGIPVIYTAHDFYYVCPNVKMLDNTGQVCICNESPDCAKCLKEKSGVYEKNEYLKRWREQHKKALDICQKIVVPSESTKEILIKFYPEQRNKIKVIPHGMGAPELLTIDESKLVYNHDFKWKIERVDKKQMCIFVAGVAYLKEESRKRYKVILRLKDSKGRVIYLPTNFGQSWGDSATENRFFAYIPNAILSDGDIEVRVILSKGDLLYIRETKTEIIRDCKFKHNNKFKVAFIGGISEEKGGKIITEMIKRGPEDVEWYVFGGIGEENLFKLEKSNLLKTGYYYQEDLHTLLLYHKIDAVCILSKWPETFSYTLSEAVLNHLPVIVTDIGALGQRTREEGFGVTVPVDGITAVDQALKIIEVWKRKGTEYEKILLGQRDYNHPDLENMASKYSRLYSELAVAREKQEIVISTECNKVIWHACISQQMQFQNESELLNYVNELERKLLVIENSITFKLVLKLTSINIPFKKQLRAILSK